MAAARLGVRVRALMGVDGLSEKADELAVLQAAGVEVRTVRLASAPVFANHERPAGRFQVAHSASDLLPVDSLPAAWLGPDAVVLNPVAGELADDWAGAFADSTLVALGWQGLFRRLTAGDVVAALPLRVGPLVERADLAVVSADDARAGGGPLAELLRPGQQLVVTNGPRGALHIQRRPTGLSARYLPSLPIARIGDPTGAGDVLLATWAAALAAAHARGSNPEPWRALAVAVAAASAKVEARSLDELADLQVICARLLRPPADAPRRG